MRYLFFCKKCNSEVVLEFSMNDDEGRKNAKCPICDSKVERRYSTPMISIKGEKAVSAVCNNSFTYNGEGVNFGFARYGENSGLSDRSVAKRVSGARVDEKTGRLVVDVVSNVKDPLGKIDKSRKETVKKSINQTVKVRK